MTSPTYRAAIIGCGRIADSIEDEIEGSPGWQLLPFSHAGGMIAAFQEPGTVSVGGQMISAVPGAKREEAWDFMKFIGASDEGTSIIARISGIPGWLKSPGLNDLAKDPLQKAYVDGLRRAQSVQLGYYAPFALNLNPIQEVIDGKRSVRDALEAVNREANQSLKDLRAQLPK